MKKILATLLIIVLCVTISGCGDSSDDKNMPDYSSRMNFYKEDFEKEYSHYDKSLKVEPNNKIIKIVGTTTSGEIDIKIVCSNETISKSFDYKVDGKLSEIIELSEYKGCSWTAEIDVYDDTEGFIKFSVY